MAYVENIHWKCKRLSQLHAPLSYSELPKGEIISHFAQYFL